jgi:signal transduction histidine kinase
MLTKRFRFFPIILFSVFLPSILLFIYGYSTLTNKGKKNVMLNRGVYKYTDVDSTYKYYMLNGDVEFYWKKLISPQEFGKNHPPMDGYLKIPGLWNGRIVNGKKIDGKGYATLRFWLDLKRNKTYGLKIKEFFCAYKIWINGVPITNCGRVGTSKEEEIPCWERLDIYFPTRSNRVEVIIQISNFQHWKGGPETCMVLGEGKNIIRLTESHLGTSFFILGVLLVMGVYHLVLYMYRKRDKSALVFSIFCFIVLLRHIATGDKLVYHLLNNPPWIAVIRIEYLSFIFGSPVFLHFIRLIYPQIFSERLLKGVYVMAIFFCLAVFFLPSNIFTYTPIIYQIVTLISCLYVFYVLKRAIELRLEYASILICSCFFFFVVFLNDILYYNKLVDTSYLSPIGFFVVVFSQSLVLSKKSAVAFRNVEILSDKLQLYNKELEDVVEERTQSISFQKQEIESKADELKRVNEKLVKVDRLKNALTAMIVHDLKNPLNMVLNYSNDARITSAGHQMLSLVQNILDIQKYENDKMVLNKHQILIGTVVERSLASVTYFAAQHGISIVNKIPRSIELDIDADVVERIFTNLLTNALKYTPMNSEVVLSFAINDDKVRFTIADKGPGIPMEKGDIIFEKYGSYNEQMLGRVKPTGLGLTFCKMAVEAHGGAIGFESELGRGTQMWFTLPLYFNRKLEEIEADTNEESCFNIYEQPTFQSIEEEQAFQKVVRTLLEIEVYKASRIRRVLVGEMPKGNSSIAKWVDTLLSSVWTGNECRYKQQLVAAAQPTPSAEA